jgi:hypothetical protein
MDITDVVRDLVAYSNTLLPLLKATLALSFDDLYPALSALSMMTVLAKWCSVPTKRAVVTTALRDFSTQRLA